MLHELKTTIEYGCIIWGHLRTATYDYSKTTTLFTLLSLAENNIISIANSLAIRHRLNSLPSISHPLSQLIDFYSAPSASCRISRNSVQQQIIEYQKKPDIVKPFYWNNYFAPIFCSINMSDINETMKDIHEEETHLLSSARSSNSTSKARRDVFTVDDTGIQKISELVAAQLYQDREKQQEAAGDELNDMGFISASDTLHVPTTQESNTLWKYRLTLYRRRNAFPHMTAMLDLFKSFAYELFHKDKHASILPVATEHSTFTHITSVKQIQAMDLSRMKIYFRSFAKHQVKSLSGEFLIQSIIHPDNFRDVSTMGEWLVAHKYDARPSISQNEEMRVIGCLLYSNHFINRDALSQAIMDDVGWNPDEEEDFGAFHLSLRNFSVENKTSIRILFVSAEVSKMEKMTEFFSLLYDGSAKRYPYCTPLLFVPLYRCNLSSEFRAQLIRMHNDRIGEAVTATTIKGWHSLDSPILLHGPDGSTARSTVKELLLSLPASPGMVTPYLFTNIEPQPNSDFFLAVYAVANEDLIDERLKSLSKDIHKLLAPGESAKFFIEPLRGLTFGKDIRQYIVGNQAIQNSSPSSALQLQRLTHMVRSPSTKRSPPSETPRSTRRKPEESSSRVTATTTSYSGVTQMNTTSFSSPTTSFTSSSATHEISMITIERRFEHRFVAIETQQRGQKEQQEEMNVKLDLLDEVAHESNSLIKQMMNDLKNSVPRGAKRDKPSDSAVGDQDETMGIRPQLP
mmetsp:Transcript_15432/g.21999  ORF Transcript_15432/g.21999 Transcript_15432/m.21999 type:complete len:741 (-) Transcript_15432:85-2307(-)